MYCKKCGMKMDDNAKFCPSCGERTDATSSLHPFETNSVDSSQNYQYQTSTFKGQQYNTGNNGTINFGSKRKSGVLKRLLIVFAIFFGIGLVWGYFSDSGPIYNLETATDIDLDTYQPVNITNTFSVTTPVIYITFSVRDYDIGTDIQADWYYLETSPSTYFNSSLITIQYDEVDAYFSLTMPNGGWSVGEYEVDFFAGEDYVISVGFTVE